MSTELEHTIDLERTAIKLANWRFVAVITAIISSTVWLTNQVNMIRHRLDAMITLSDFLVWQDQLQRENPNLKVPNMAVMHRAGGAKIPTDQEVAGMKGVSYAR